MHDIERAYTLMLGICGIGIVIDSLERLASITKYRASGIFSWVVLRQRLVSMPSPIRRLADLLLAGEPGLIVVLLFRIVAVVLVVSSPIGSAPFGFGLTALVLGQVYVLVRSGFGAIGADPMTLVVCGASWLATVITRTPVAARAGLWFIAAQVCLGYAVAGGAKLAAPKWRSGDAMTTLLSTYTYGSRRFFMLLQRLPWLSRFLCWAVMLWEATFPAVIVLPDELVAVQLALGILFHASIASLMGLNLFLAAFPSTYVAVWAIRH
jgi:hypothetical protein